MKLTYRGNSYEVAAPIELDSDSTELPQIKLIYRGNTYYYIPHPVVDSEEVETDEPTVNLIYRGNTYKRQLRATKPYQKAHAINWRWHSE
jgi:lipopolysaccharide export system protein LptA